MKELNVQALEQTNGGVVVIVAAIGAACVYLGYKAVELGIDIGKNIYDLATGKNKSKQESHEAAEPFTIKREGFFVSSPSFP